MQQMIRIKTFSDQLLENVKEGKDKYFLENYLGH